MSKEKKIEILKAAVKNNRLNQTIGLRILGGKRNECEENRCRCNTCMCIICRGFN